MIRILSTLFFLGALPMVATAADRDLPVLPKAITSFGAAVNDGFVYVYGGHAGKAHSYSNETTLGAFQRMNLAKPMNWEALPGGPIVQGLAVVAHEGNIYRIGGMQPQNKASEKTDAVSLPSVSRFDVKTQKWEELLDMPDGRSSHDAVVVGDKIFVAGGWKMNGAGKESVWHDKALVLDLKQPKLAWEVIEQPFKRRALTMAAYDGKVYVLAGLNSEGMAERTVNIYDPEKKTWSKGTEIPDGPMNGFTPAACVVGGRLYVSPADGKLYRLNEKGNAWDEVGTLKQGRVVHRIVPIAKNQLLVIGGSSKGAPVAELEAVTLTK